MIVVTGVPLILADKLLGGGNGTAGLAASSTAGAAVANPAIIGEMIPKFKPMVPAATVIVPTACLVPILTSMGAKRAARLSGIPIIVAARAGHGAPIEHEGHV